MIEIRVTYLDTGGSPSIVILQEDGYLTYDDLLADPVMVRRIRRDGLLTGRETRSGTIIPPHRILQIEWEDDYK